MESACRCPLGCWQTGSPEGGPLAGAGILQAAGSALWTIVPGFIGFAGGFVLWGLGGALVSGALEALLLDGLASVGAEEHDGQLAGRVAAAGLGAQLPAVGAATITFSIGGYGLVGWTSVGVCLGAAAVASRLPEPPRQAPLGAEAKYTAVLRAGWLMLLGTGS